MTLKEFLNHDEDILVWHEDTIGNEKQYQDYTVISGHRTVQHITGDCSDHRILHRTGTIYIDCGCTFKNASGRLACLRLDDMKEFYVDNFIPKKTGRG